MDDRYLIEAFTETLAGVWASPSMKVEVQPEQGHASQVVLRTGGNRYEFDVETKRQVTTGAAVLLAAGLEEWQRERYLLVTKKMQPAVAEVLREHRINYADAAGNCHIERGTLCIHVEGKRAEKPNHSSEPVRAFSGEGLRAVFVLLLQPDLASRPYRELSDLSGASHGVVQYTVGDLDRLGFLVRMGRTRRRLLKVPDLLDRWATGYADHLRPKRSLGRFRFTDGDRAQVWQQLNLDPAHDRWGGEPAAALYTNYLKPGALSVYTHGRRSDIMKRLRLLPDERGSVEVLRSFWPKALEEELAGRFEGPAVPDVLAYADLLATDDPRNAEVAAMLRERIVEEAEHG